MIKIIKKYVLLIVILMTSVSCLDDIDTQNKKSLFNFFIEMKEKIIEDNLKWVQKKSLNDFDVFALEYQLIEANDSLKNFFIGEELNDYAISKKIPVEEELSDEYSVTIKYIIDEDGGRSSTIVVRLSYYSPTYYYITLKLKKNKWMIESIDKLPLD